MTTRFDEVHGTAPIHTEKSVARAAITIKRPLDEVELALKDFALPGIVELAQAPGDRGVEVRVALNADVIPAASHLLETTNGTSRSAPLKGALRALKAKLEAGETPTVEGQPSGRD